MTDDGDINSCRDYPDDLHTWLATPAIESLFLHAVCVRLDISQLSRYCAPARGTEVLSIDATRTSVWPSVRLSVTRPYIDSSAF